MEKSAKFFFYFIGVAMAFLSYFATGYKDQMFFLALTFGSFAFSETNLDQKKLSFQDLKNIGDSKIQISWPGKLLEAISLAIALLWLILKMFD